MTEDDVFKFYRDIFQAIYSDLVAATQSKPTQILIEIENAMTHLSSAKVHDDLAMDNCKKAKGHLMRASLDCAKMLWIEKSKQIRSFTNDRDLKRYCINCSEAEFSKLIQSANSLAREARTHEIKNVGIAPLTSIEQYYEAAKALDKALNVCDYEKLASFKQFQLVHWIKHHAVSLFVGLVSGVIVTWIFQP